MHTLRTIECGPLNANCYLLWHNGECFAVDPADDGPILALLEKEGLKLTHILLTHGHFDHVMGVAALCEKTGATVCIQEEDADMLLNPEGSLAGLMGVRVPPVRADRLVQDGDVLSCAGFDVRVLHTPGHSPGCVCYVIEAERILFSGDTLFRLSVGRSDFPGSDEAALRHSIAEKLFALEGEYTVYPGHMRSTTLDFERARNPFIRREKR